MRKARQKQIFLVVEIKDGRFFATAVGEGGETLLEYERTENISVEPDADARAFVLECRSALEKPNIRIRLGVVTDLRDVDFVDCELLKSEGELIREEMSLVSKDGAALLVRIGEQIRTVLAVGGACTESNYAQDGNTEKPKKLAEHILSLCSLVRVDTVIIEALGKYANDGVAVTECLKNKLGDKTEIRVLEKSSLAAFSMLRILCDQKY